MISNATGIRLFGSFRGLGRRQQQHVRLNKFFEVRTAGEAKFRQLCLLRDQSVLVRKVSLLSCTSSSAASAAAGPSSSIPNSSIMPTWQILVKRFSSNRRILLTVFGVTATGVLVMFKNEGDNEVGNPVVLATTGTVQSRNDSISLFFPTLEALVRVSRLVKTATLMAMDYKLYEWFEITPSFSNVQNLLPFTQQQKIDTDHTKTTQSEASLLQKQKDLRELLDRQQVEFERRQEIYSTDNSNKTRYDDHDADYNKAEAFQRRIDKKRAEKEAMQDAAAAIARTQHELDNLWNEYYKENGTSDVIQASSSNANPKSKVHAKAAQRLLELCQMNRGAYIKIGQHLANFDYILPNEYIDTLQALYNENPIMTPEDVIAVIQEDLGVHPNELFIDFDPSAPIASASLAQVHVAYLKQSTNNDKDACTNKTQQQLQKLAIKVQHRGLRETSVGDIFSLTCAVRAAEYLFPDFQLGWIVDELAPNLPRELNFINEGENSERAASNLQRVGLADSCIIPKVEWNCTSSRVLTMNFEEGFKATDTKQMKEAGLNLYEVAKLINKVFASQVYLSGFVHSDPHPANVLIRQNPTNKNKPQIVLLDHGLYRTLQSDFRLQYSSLWKNIMVADIDGIRHSCAALGLGDKTFALFTAILTARPFDEIIERSKNKGSGPMKQRQPASNGKSKSDTDDAVDHIILRSYAQRYLPQIIQLLDSMPREMILLLKTGDCLRHINHTLLGSASLYSASSLLINGRFASRAIYEYQLQSVSHSIDINGNDDKTNSQSSTLSTESWRDSLSFLSIQRLDDILHRLWIWVDYIHVIARIQIHEIALSYLEKQRHS